MKNEEFNWKTTDGLNIYAKEWKASTPIAVIGLVHGLGEHINRYNHLASYFTKKNYTVIGYDQRGHGQSEGKRGHTPDIDSLLDGISQLLVEVELRHPDLPVFLYGHSMGGGIVLNYVLRRHPTIAGAIVTAPWIELAFQPSSSLVILGKIMRFLHPKFSQPNDLDTGHLSHDPNVEKDYLADPLVHNKVSSALGIGMLEAGKWLLAFKGKVNIPLLIMHGTDDQITSAQASERFAAQLSGDVTFKSWEGLYHEIHNEIQQDQIFSFANKWMSAYLP
ncbi:MAG: lysophospholipase [Saprospiraceae bacterium]|nr:MAG: lysophospholipase [Saprospiraceae bacterium]